MEQGTYMSIANLEFSNIAANEGRPNTCLFIDAFYTYAVASAGSVTDDVKSHDIRDWSDEGAVRRADLNDTHDSFSFLLHIGLKCHIGQRETWRRMRFTPIPSSQSPGLRGQSA